MVGNATLILIHRQVKATLAEDSHMLRCMPVMSDTNPILSLQPNLSLDPVVTA